MGVLFPYNTLINCVDWYQHIYPEIDLVGQMASSMMTAILLTTISLLPISTAKFPPAVRITVGFVLELGVLAYLAARVGETSTPPSVSLLKLLAVIVGFGDAMAQSSMYVLAGQLDPQVTAVVVTGCAVAGLGSSVLKLCTRAVCGDLRSDTRTFFAVSSLLILICLFTLRLALSLIERTHSQPCEEQRLISKKREAQTVASISTITVYRETLLVIWKPIVTLFLNFFVTLSLFPGPVSSFVSSGLLTQRWIAVLLISSFNLFDCFGRLLLHRRLFGKIPDYLLAIGGDGDGDGKTDTGTNTGAPHFCNANYMLLYPSLARFGFFPLIIACHSTTLPILHRDGVRLCIVLLMAVTNGFLAASCFMIGPVMMVFYADRGERGGGASGSVYGDRHRDAASLLLMLSSIGGLTAGAFFESIVDAVVTLNTRGDL